ncbi:unnamed protein product [Cylicocyclus nassatus]|uniref:Uncharacterized protein n=1 Tax=Cylicocyclus nassatus TaxID=53992 RepID=A0AA36DMB6_CYLNA|nr:unnamed protein product [Cylicocyclus nassatus]
MKHLTIILSVLPILISAKSNRGWPPPTCEALNQFNKVFEKQFNLQYKDAHLHYDCELRGRTKQLMKGRPIDKTERGLYIVKDVHRGNFTNAQPQLADKVIHNKENLKFFIGLNPGTRFGCTSLQEEIKKEEKITRGLCWLYWKVFANKASWRLRDHEKRRLKKLKRRCVRHKKIDQATVICLFNQTQSVHEGNE